MPPYFFADSKNMNLVTTFHAAPGYSTEDERLGVPKCGFYYSSPYKKTTFKAGIEMNLLPCLVILI